MKRLTSVALSMVLAASVISCRRDERANTANNTPAGRDSAVGTSGVSNADRDFILDGVEDNQAEIEVSKLAEERATNPQVKEFARMMVRDHTKAVGDLREVAQAANVQLNTDKEPDRDHVNLKEDLAKLNGNDFDRKYIDAMVDEHEEMVSELKKHVDGDNVQIRKWAAQNLPTVEKHRDRAKELKDTLRKTT